MTGKLVLRIVSIAVLMALSGCGLLKKDEVVAEPVPAPPAPSRTVDWEQEVKPILENKCVHCHNLETMAGRTSFENKALAFTSGSRGPVITPFEPEESRIMDFVQAPWEREEAMPPVGHRVTASEERILRTWIEEGAYWPEGAAGTLESQIEVRE